MTTFPSTLISDTDLSWASERVGAINDAVGRRIIGQENLREALLIALFARGHILLESVPGLAKTLAARTLADSIAGVFSRIQCTPDLLPSDIIGSQVFNPGTSTFRTELGPIHANLVLLDEINRSSAKTQSAMLEAMQEHQVTIGGVSYAMLDPFCVIATQNPIDDEGTHILPLAQMDRFLIKEIVPYPSVQAEIDIVGQVRSGLYDTSETTPACSLGDILALQRMTRRVAVDPRLVAYAVEIVTVTRHPQDRLDASLASSIERGSSPRGSIGLIEAAAARALIHGRAHAIPDDIIAVRHGVLRHRIQLTFEAMAMDVAVESIIDAVFDVVPAP